MNRACHDDRPGRPSARLSGLHRTVARGSGGSFTADRHHEDPRVPALIGLRGVATLTVVFLLVLFSSPSLVFLQTGPSLGGSASSSDPGQGRRPSGSLLLRLDRLRSSLGLFTRREQSQSYFPYYPRPSSTALSGPVGRADLHLLAYTRREPPHDPGCDSLDQQPLNVSALYASRCPAPACGDDLRRAALVSRVGDSLLALLAVVCSHRACVQALGSYQGPGRYRRPSTGSSGCQGLFNPDQQRHSLLSDVRRRRDHPPLRNRTS